jgi:hypothetical protein
VIRLIRVIRVNRVIRVIRVIQVRALTGCLLHVQPPYACTSQWRVRGVVYVRTI